MVRTVNKSSHLCTSTVTAESDRDVNIRIAKEPQHYLNYLNYYLEKQKPQYEDKTDHTSFSSHFEHSGNC